MTYSQAAQLTWPQLIHVLGISRDAVSDEEIGHQIRAAQDEMFTEIVMRRRCLAKDLLRVPVNDLIGLVSAEIDAKAPMATVLKNLHRFAAQGA